VKRSRPRQPPPRPPPPPTVPELVDAPELAALMGLEHALRLAVDALLAEHMTLIDDFRSPDQQGPVVLLADAICRSAASLSQTLGRYRQAVRAAVSPPAHDASDDNLF
jgi:hypothetical protein